MSVEAEYLFWGFSLFLMATVIVFVYIYQHGIKKGLFLESSFLGDALTVFNEISASCSAVMFLKRFASWESSFREDVVEWDIRVLDVIHNQGKYEYLSFEYKFMDKRVSIFFQYKTLELHDCVMFVNVMRHAKNYTLKKNFRYETPL